MPQRRSIRSGLGRTKASMSAYLGEKEKDTALFEIVQRLQQIPLFKEHSEYIGKCILNGLLVSNSDIQENSKIGTICTSNHSYRNALIYNDEKQEIKELNILLSKL